MGVVEDQGNHSHHRLALHRLVRVPHKQVEAPHRQVEVLHK